MEKWANETIKPFLLKYKLIKFILIISVLVSFYSCSITGNSTSTIVSTSYDKDKNLTTHTVFPYGSIDIPNKWEKINYISSSRQYILMNEDSINLFISFSTIDKYEFNKDKSLQGYDFLKAFYKWEADYFNKEFALQNEIIEENKVRKYIIFKIFGEKVNSIFLVHEKEGFITNLSIHINSKWNDNQEIDFLKSLIKVDK